MSVNPLVVGGSGQFYNITITIANSATTAPLLITDALPTGINLSGAPTVTGGTSTGVTLASCPASGSTTAPCQINTGASVGTIIVRVPVNVAASATNGNNTANLDGGGDPACNGSDRTGLTTQPCPCRSRHRWSRLLRQPAQPRALPWRLVKPSPTP
ncbi:MAG: hypothetical protein IPI14_11930 [Polaromonas sp.]|nr:hypothetical protein [Polaromonas sp.]